MIGHGGSKQQGFSMDGLTADYLVEFAGEAMDIARGLGDKVIVIGLSAGGAIAAWIAQYRADVEMVVLVSPFFGPYALPLSAFRFPLPAGWRMRRCGSQVWWWGGTPWPMLPLNR